MAVNATSPALSENNYQYRGLKAATWDLFVGQATYWEDTFFFQEIILRHGQPALEVGCGTGRLLLNYLADGIDIDGVDNSPEMLAICRQKAAQKNLQPALFRQSMEKLTLPRRYRTIIIPAGSFQLVTDLTLAGQALSRFFDHLEPGGVLAMRFMLMWQPGDPTQTDWRLRREAIRPEDGALIRWWSRASYDTAAQLEHTEERYEISWQGNVFTTEVQAHSPAARWYSRDQAVEFFQTAGFANVRLIEEPTATPDNRHFAVMGTKD